MMPDNEWEVGMTARIRDDAYEGQNGIFGMDRYRGRVLTVLSLEGRVCGGLPKGVRFVEDGGYYWFALDQIEHYVDPEYIIDLSQMTTLLEVL